MPTAKQVKNDGIVQIKLKLLSCLLKYSYLAKLISNANRKAKVPEAPDEAKRLVGLKAYKIPPTRQAAQVIGISTPIPPNILFLRQSGDARQCLAFEEFEASSAAGGDVGDAGGEAGFMNCGDRVSATVRTMCPLRLGPNRYRCCLIEADQHLGGKDVRLVEAARGEVDDEPHLFAVQTVEPFHEVVNAGSAGQIFKDRGDRHPSAAEYPGTAELSGDAFDCGALRPIES